MNVVTYRFEANVAHIELNRPRVLNAIDGPMLGALAEAFERAKRDGARAGLLSGAGGAFCAGADLASLGQSLDLGDPVAARAWIERMHLTLLEPFEMDIPWVAAVRGAAVGAGCQVALMCDVVLMGADAYFYWAFAKRGLSVDGGGTWLLPRLVGLQRAKQLLLTPRKVRAEEAQTLGLAVALDPAQDVLDEARTLARALAQGPTVALGSTKAALNRSFELTFHQALEQEAQAQAITLTTQDVREGIGAFLDKREPHFKGK